MDDLTPKRPKGFTLMELLIAVALISVIMLSATALYVAAWRFFLSLNGTVASYTGGASAMETIFRTGNASEDFRYFGSSAPEIQLYHFSRMQGVSPLYAWDQFRIMPDGHLRWKQGAASISPPPPVTQVAVTDPDLDAALVLQPGSTFQLVNPTQAIDPANPGSPVVIQMIFITSNGAQNSTIQTSFAVTGASKV